MNDKRLVNSYITTINVNIYFIRHSNNEISATTDYKRNKLNNINQQTKKSQCPPHHKNTTLNQY